MTAIMLPSVYFAAIAATLLLVLRLSCGVRVMGRHSIEGAARIPLVAAGWALSTFLVLTFAACVVFDLLVPGSAMHEAWAPLLPGFVWLTPVGFVIGRIDSFL